MIGYSGTVSCHQSYCQISVISGNHLMRYRKLLFSDVYICHESTRVYVTPRVNYEEEHGYEEPEGPKLLHCSFKFIYSDVNFRIYPYYYFGRYTNYLCLYLFVRLCLTAAIQLIFSTFIRPTSRRHRRSYE